MIKAVIFDCFGVVLTDGLEATIAQRGIDGEHQAQIVELVTAVNKGLMVPGLYLAEVARLLGLTVDDYIASVKGNEVKNTQLLDYIRSLRPAYKTAMLSNVSSAASLKRRFADGELTQYFDTVVASGEIGYAKPEAQAYEITVDQLGVRLEESVMVDDREDYCQGARGGGMQAVLYRTFDQMQHDLAEIIAHRQ